MTKYFKQKVVVKILQATGHSETPDTTAVTVIAKDSDGDITECKGLTVPTDTETGFAKGCTFVDTDVAAGTSGVYENVGTTTSCNFDLRGTISTDSVTSDSIITDAVKSDEIDDDSIEEVDVTAGLKTDLVTVGLKGTIAEFSFPFNVVVYTEQAAALAKIDDGGSFANLADSAGEGGYTGAYQLFPDTELEDDAAYFGAAAPFGILNFNVSATVATYGADSVAWEYWDGAAWSALTILYDETDTTAQNGLRPFQQDGEIIFSAPTDWASTTVDSQAAYWIRARIKAGFNVTQIPLLDSQEHKLVTSPTASEAPATGTIGRSRLSWTTASGANNDTKIILCNLTKGTASAIKTLTQALIAHEVADFAVLCDAGDQIVIYVTQEDETTEFANGIMEMSVVKS